MSFLSALPAPRHTSAPRAAEQPAPTSTAVALIGSKEPPPYLRRKSYIPRKPEDFGDGGAFPEIQMAQYPLDMGKQDVPQGRKSATLAVSVDAEGRITYDALLRQGANRNKIIHADHKALVPKVDDLNKTFERPDEEAVAAAAAETAAALGLLVDKKVAANQAKALPAQPGGPTYIKYTPQQQGAAYASGAGQRIIRMQEMPVDPMEPPKFRHTKVPRGPGSPPVPVLHSPPKPLSAKEAADWKVPPCISNWKNAKGYTIPLDKRLAADGRGLQDVTINDKFAGFAEALYVAEKKAREAVQARAAVKQEVASKQKAAKEQELRELAMRARLERGGAPGAAAAASGYGGGGVGGGLTGRMDGGGFGAGGLPPPPAMEKEGYERAYGGERDRGGYGRGGSPASGSDSEGDRAGPAGRGGGGGGRSPDGQHETREEREARRQRDAIREERRRERERERRLEARDAHPSKKSKLTRDRDRDVGEKMALGMAAVGGAAGGDVQYDARLFNQDAGMSSGFGADDSYTAYDKPLFADRGSSLYRPRAEADEAGEAARSFKPDKGFAGAEISAGPRSAPVEFERPAGAEEADPFGLNQFMSEVKSGQGRKGALDGIGRSGGMAAGAGGGTGDGGSGRRMNFKRGDA